MIEQQNATQIKTQLESQVGVKLNINIIDNILKWFRWAFAHYITDIYKLNKIGKRNGGSNITIDESLFIHINGKKYG